MQESLAVEVRQKSLLEERFFSLASNHQEMIKLKDEYKEAAARLRCAVEGMGESKENVERRCMEVLNVEKEKVEVLEEQVRVVKGERMRIEEERDAATREVHKLEKKLQVVSEQQKKHHQALLDGGSVV